MGDENFDLGNELFGLFSQAFRSVGVAFGIKQMEELRRTCDKLAAKINHQATRASIVATQPAFKAVEEDANDLADRVVAIEDKLEDIDKV